MDTVLNSYFKLIAIDRISGLSLENHYEWHLRKICNKKNPFNEVIFVSACFEIISLDALLLVIIH